MTNKEAIEELKELKESTWAVLVRPIEAFDLAIKALEAKDRLLKLCEQCEEENGQTHIHINDVRLILAEGGRQ